MRTTRAACARVEKKFAADEMLFGLEQEYTMLRPDGTPLGFPPGGGQPGPQGPYYCGVGTGRIMGRDIVEEHTQACIDAGLMISGTNPEVMPGQWEFQVGPLGPTAVGDQLNVARWLLHRIAEDYDVAISLDAKPKKGDWNGAGCHTNFSNKAMRDDYKAIIAACEAIGKNYMDLVLNYGDGVLRNGRMTTRGFQNIGMISDCEAGDVDGDGDDDIIAVGDWQGVRLWMNDAGQFAERTLEAGFDHSQGLWNTVRLEDLDGDGALDIIAGNLGENCRLEASVEKPMVLFVNDFDNNTYSDPILCSYWGDTLFPRVLRHNMISQLPYLKKENLEYSQYAGKSVFEVFDTTQLERSALLQVQTLRTTCFYNNGNGVFSHATLPIQAQTAPVYAIDALDVDGDGDKDLILGGNLYEVQPEWGRYDASRGTVLLNTGNREWRAATQLQSGLNIDGQVRDITHYQRDGQTYVLFSKVDGLLEEYKLSH